jgi:MFS family permease
MAASNAVLQTIVEEEKRGRVMSFYTMAFFGMGPLGSLLAGALAGTIGILPTFLTFGAIALAASLVFATLLPELQRTIRPMYVRAGILRETIDTIPAGESALAPGNPHFLPLPLPSPQAVPRQRAAA